jgi:hypothetical protein
MAVTNIVSSTNHSLPNDVIGNIIFRNLSLSTLGTCSLVCKAWKKMAQENIKAFSHPHAFGPKEWYIYFGCRTRDVPRLPSDIEVILNSQCPFWPNKKVHKTHVLSLIPQTVNGKPLNLKFLGELVQKPLKGNASKYRNCLLGEYTDLAAPKSQWVLLTRDVIKESRNMAFAEQQALIQAKPPYEVPTILDITICIFMEYARTGTRLYSHSPWTFTRCQEQWAANLQLVVGGFSADGLNVVDIRKARPSEMIGIRGFRKHF